MLSKLFIDDRFTKKFNNSSVYIMSLQYIITLAILLWIFLSHDISNNEFRYKVFVGMCYISNIPSLGL